MPQSFLKMLVMGRLPVKSDGVRAVLGSVTVSTGLWDASWGFKVYGWRWDICQLLHGTTISDDKVVTVRQGMSHWCL